MNDVQVVADMLVANFEAGGAHARIVAKQIVDRLLGDGADMMDEPLQECVDGRCAACGQALPEFGGIVCDDERGEIRFGGKFIRNLTGQEHALFRILLDGKGRTISKENLLMALYARKFYADDEMPEMKIIDVFICKLRKKIAPLGLFLVTSWGKGYALSVPSDAKGEKAA